MPVGSLQLRTYRIARRGGKSTNDSALEAGITMGEARLIDADDAKNPPPEEAYTPLGNTEGKTSMTDPIEALGIGLREDHQAEKAKRGRKPKAETVPEPVTDEQVEQAGKDAASADAPASAGDTASSDASTTSDNVTSVGIAAAIIGNGAIATLSPTEQESPAGVVAATEPAAIFDRRIERLVRIAEGAKFEGGTLFGDFRSAVLDIFKHRPKVWTAMSSDEQRQLVTFVEATCKRFLERIVLVVAENEGESLQATFLGNFAVKGDAIEAKVKIDAIDSDVLVDAYKLAGHRVIIVSADSKRFMGAGAPPTIDPDQLGMGFGDGPAPKPQAEQPAEVQHPADDSDLAGEDDSGPAGEAENDDPPAPVELDPNARYRIKATSDGAYLIDGGGGDDGWTENAKDAGDWDAEETANLLDEFGGPAEVTPEKVEG